jgi:hypothetical protein
MFDCFTARRNGVGLNEIDCGFCLGYVCVCRAAATFTAYVLGLLTHLVSARYLLSLDENWSENHLMNHECNRLVCFFEMDIERVSYCAYITFKLYTILYYIPSPSPSSFPGSSHLNPSSSHLLHRTSAPLDMGLD